MVILKVLYINLLFVLLLVNSGWASLRGDVKIRAVEVSCQEDQAAACADIENRFSDFEGVTFDSQSFLDRINFKIIDSPYLHFSYKLVSEENVEGYVLQIEATLKKTISSIGLTFDNDINLPEVRSSIPVKVGDRFDQGVLKRIRSSLTRAMADRGFSSPSFDFDVNHDDDREVEIVINVKLSNVIMVDDVKIATSNPKLIGRVESRFRVFRGEVLDRLKFKLAVDQLSRELFESGFYESEVTTLPEQKVREGEGVILRVQVKYGPLYSFHFQGNKYLSRSELLRIYNDSIRKSNTSSTLERFKEDLIKAYEEMGLYNTTVAIRRVEGVNKSDLTYFNFFVTIEEGKKKRMHSVEFSGNSAFSESKLESLYDSKSSVLASRSFLDESYLENFREELISLYLSHGYVFIDVSRPIIDRSSDDGVDVSYSIRERQQATLSNIEISPIPSDVESSILNTLTNKEGRPLDVTALEEDLDQVLEYLHKKGYFFAEIENLNSDDLLQYSSNYSEVDLNIKLTQTRQVRLNSIIISGFNKTKQEVIRRGIELDQGELVTPDHISEIRDRLLGLDLFSQVRVNPKLVRSDDNKDDYIDIMIQVSEKAFGVGEIAPGFRTDLGAKASVGITYNNISGMNRSLSLQMEANQRIDYSDFDSRRRAEEKELLEYSFKTSFTEPYLFPNLLDWQIQFDTGLSFQRKRFVSFDADIFRFSPQISKTFFNKLTLSLKYQFERIGQFDATNEDFNDDFTIGSITPSATIDLRDDPVRPMKGAYFGLNWEFANPYFLSMDDEDITVNYYRLTSRNNFYIPFSDSFTLALSVAGGVQKNFSDEIRRDENGDPILDSDGNVVRTGFIPSTKVFRLDGIDTVRGFSGQDINRLLDGRNVGEVVVSDIAYFLNLKLEPRYYVSDTFAIGTFLDAGRVFVEKFQPLEVRTSAGLTFKLLTPVGSLDFDYGVKLKRERYDDGNRESFGRFHLTIGFF